MQWSELQYHLYIYTWILWNTHHVSYSCHSNHEPPHISEHNVHNPGPKGGWFPSKGQWHFSTSSSCGQDVDAGGAVAVPSAVFRCRRRRMANRNCFGRQESKEKSFGLVSLVWQDLSHNHSTKSWKRMSEWPLIRMTIFEYLECIRLHIEDRKLVTQIPLRRFHS